MKSNQSVFISVVDPPEAIHTSGEDYGIRCEDNLYYWQGLNSGYGYEDYCSDSGWPTPEQAQADALYCLTCLDGDSNKTAMQTLTSWRFFSINVLNGCERENSCQAEQTSAGENVLSPHKIRAELEQLASTGSATAADYRRLYGAWLAVKETTPLAYHQIIVDRLNALLRSVKNSVHAIGAADIGATARSTLAAMNTTDLVLDKLKRPHQH